MSKEKKKVFEPKSHFATIKSTINLVYFQVNCERSKDENNLQPLFHSPPKSYPKLNTKYIFFLTAANTELINQIEYVPKEISYS